MRSTNIMAATLLGLFVFAIWLSLHWREAKPSITVGFTSARGHFPEPPRVVAQALIVAWVTNSERSIVVLDLPSVLEETSTGHVVTDQGPSWNQEGYSRELPRGSSAWLASGFDEDTKRLKFVFDYHRDNALLKIISKPLGLLPQKLFPRRTYEWLRRHGMIDGAVHDHYESPWFANNAMH